MADLPVALSAVSLRLAGHAGQTALDRIGEFGAAALADLDQHVAAVRAELTVCRPPLVTSAQLAGLAAGRALAAASAASPGLRWQPRRRAVTLPVYRGPALASCPDVPFAADARHAEPVLPARLLLHYTCGLMEAAISSGWRPSESGRGSDPHSMRLAAVCQLISEAEATVRCHQDLPEFG